MRVKCIHTKVTTKVLHFIFLQSSSDKPQGMPLLDYYSSKGISVSKFKAGLYAIQKAKIDADPDGLSFDITLLCVCLRKGSHGLADENVLWHVGNSSLESLITSLKNKRNDVSHDVTLQNQALSSIYLRGD